MKTKNLFSILFIFTILFSSCKKSNLVAESEQTFAESSVNYSSEVSQNRLALAESLIAAFEKHPEMKTQTAEG